LIQQRPVICKGASVCVVVAAFNAERTIARALRSALAEPEVCEVILVDDLSCDGTIAAAQACDDGSGRLRLLRQSSNQGPAAARNRALDESKAPNIAILDADDMILPGRFAALLAEEGWDAVADNIAFLREDVFADQIPNLVRGVPGRTTLSLAAFVDGNVSRRGRPRGEMGFIKPMIRRAFLERHGLRYDETLRLGEDYALYARMLAKGAHFTLLRDCGYLALERAGSLSGSHRTVDLATLLASDRNLLEMPELVRSDRAIIQRHADHIAGKLHHRQMLDIRKQKGRAAAALAAAAKPAGLASLVATVIHDKLGKRHVSASQGEVRYLFA